MNAPNLYHFVPNSLYSLLTKAGVVVTTVVSAALAFLPRIRRSVMTTDGQVLAATMFVALSPFLLPKMHDRYFFGADIFSIVLAFFRPELWLVAVVFQVSSMLAYVPIISSSIDGEWILFTVAPGAILNTITIGFLVLLFMRSTSDRAVDFAGAARHYAFAIVAAAATLALWWLTGAAYLVFSAQACPATGALSLLCGRELPVDLRHANANHWVLFVLLATATTAALWLAIRRLRPQAKHAADRL
jgi:hypothetical protein